MKKIKFVIIVASIIGLNACASYQTDMNANVPNENNPPVSKSMAPAASDDINMN